MAGSSLAEGLPRPFSVGSELDGSSGTLGESEKKYGIQKRALAWEQDTCILALAWLSTHCFLPLDLGSLPIK